MSTTLQITAEQRANLVKLARFHWDLPRSRFDMSQFRCEQGGGKQLAHSCGTVGCCAGNGPLAGIPPLEKETWIQYSTRCFLPLGPEWSWLFCESWGDADDGPDNTPRGAAKRILWLLVKGLPETATEQRTWDADLCYEHWQPTEADWAKAAEVPA